MLVDSHCHLEYKGLVEDQQGVLIRAREAGVTGFLSISTRQREWDRVIATAAREDKVWASVVACGTPPGPVLARIWRILFWSSAMLARCEK